MAQAPHALVEHPTACLGKGEYTALVHYGSPGGEIFEHVFEYGRKDPRHRPEAVVLREIIRAVPARHRPHIVALALIKRCLHPKAEAVTRRMRRPYFERLLSLVVMHDRSRLQVTEELIQHEIVYGSRPRAGRIVLPYTAAELALLPVTEVLTTDFGTSARARVGLRGIEQIIGIDILLGATGREALFTYAT